MRLPALLCALASFASAQFIQFGFSLIGAAQRLNSSVLLDSGSGSGANFLQSTAVLPSPLINPPMFRVSPCRNGGRYYVDPTMNTDILYKENGGSWLVAEVPQSAENAALQYARVQLRLLSSSTALSSYQFQIYSQLKGQALKMGVQLVFNDTQGLVTTAASTEGQFPAQLVFNVFYLGHVSGVWAYYHICSDQFVDNGIDYRYLLTHGHKMTAQEEQTLRTIDSRNQFRGSMFTIGS